MQAIGTSLPRIDALGKVTGVTQYPGDLDRPEIGRYCLRRFEGRAE